VIGQVENRRIVHGEEANKKQGGKEEGPRATSYRRNVIGARRRDAEVVSPRDDPGYHGRENRGAEDTPALYRKRRDSNDSGAREVAKCLGGHARYLSTLAHGDNIVRSPAALKA